jgi:hypothetical protein
MKEEAMTVQPTARDAHDFLVQDVPDIREYTDDGVIITLADARGSRVRLHLKIGMGELLCERIATALECRYGNSYMPTALPAAWNMLVPAMLYCGA